MAATTTSLTRTTAAKVPLWLWPNLLSLDAPLIASLWQNLFARDAGVHLSIASKVVLPAAVWLIYLADRLLDTANGKVYATARHEFCGRNRNVCFLLAGLASLTAALSALCLPFQVFRNGMAVLICVAAYLCIVHWAGRNVRAFLPKEAAVGLIFAIGSMLAPLTWSGDVHLLLPGAIFGMLCWMNAAAIEAWEGGRLDCVSGWMVPRLKLVTLIVFFVCLIASIFAIQRSWLALAMAAAGFAAVSHFEKEMDAHLLRVAIDVPLMVPILLLLR